MNSDVVESKNLTIKVRGLGHQLYISLSPSSSCSNLQTRIEEETGLPPPYQRVIIRGKTLKEDLALQQLGLQPGSTSKAILMHSPGFKIDQEAMKKITKLNQELDLLGLKKMVKEGTRMVQGGEGSGSSTKVMSKEAVKNLITEICCKLDLIDLHGSETLREIRRKVLRRAENLDKLWQNENEEEGRENC